VDPTTLDADQLTAELRDLTKALLGYGARMPKELMLYVKDMLFLDGSMATMAPDIDLLAEIVRIVTYFYEHHGEQIARDMGLDPASAPVIDLDGIRAGFGVTEPVTSLTHRELRERREAIRRRLEEHRGRGRGQRQGGDR
ncbi:MAG TPA: AarF/ABC1/UbiB kinase family protein, partial [Acidimicrobiales bacterium]|nr:AarF/ABC1/UbiB kinase family protein [Acidimicrobiales bacterium]